MWIELTIDSPVDEIFYQSDSYKSCTMVDQITGNRNIYESPRSLDLSVLLVATERVISRKRIY